MYPKGILWKQCTSENVLCSHYFRVTLFCKSYFLVHKLILHAVLSPTVSYSLFFPEADYSKNKLFSGLTITQQGTLLLPSYYWRVSITLNLGRRLWKHSGKWEETLRKARGITSEILSKLHQYKIIMTKYFSFPKYCNTYLMNQYKFGINNLSLFWYYD